jgi:hypothetical protein
VDAVVAGPDHLQDPYEAAGARPLLLVDVDGVLSLFGFDPGSPPQGRLALIDGLPHLLSDQTAEHLKILAARYDCVWCTGWEERANDHLPWLLGLPAGWPHIPLDGRGRVGRSVAGHWKLDAIDAFAGPDRPLAWIDDAHDAACEAWAAARPGTTLLVTTDPTMGLSQQQARQLTRWADEVAAG